MSVVESNERLAIRRSENQRVTYAMRTLGGLCDCDLVTAQNFSDDVQATRQRGVAEALGAVRAIVETVLTIAFSGLVSSVWAFASAVAMAAVLSLDRCMTNLHLDQIEADCT